MGPSVERELAQVGEEAELMRQAVPTHDAAAPPRPGPAKPHMSIG